MSETYICRKCGEEKGRDGFFRDVRDRRGIRTHECKACSSKVKRASRKPAPADGPLPNEVNEMFNKWVTGRLRRSP